MLRFIKPPYLIKHYFSDLVWSINENKKTLYLTFDDGPIPGVTDKILEILKAHNAKATFFCLGKNVQKHSGLYHRIINEGHAIGNHTYSHVNGWETNLQDYVADVEKAGEHLQSGLFRPPYGRIKPSQINFLKQQYKIVMWSVLSYDFSKSVDSETCWNYVKQFTHDGAVVVFHDSEKAKEKVLYALPKFLEYYSELGYSFDAIEPEFINQVSPQAL